MAVEENNDYTQYESIVRKALEKSPCNFKTLKLLIGKSESFCTTVLDKMFDVYEDDDKMLKLTWKVY